MFVAVFLAVLSVDALVVAYLIRHGVIKTGAHDGRPTTGWFDHARFRAGLEPVVPVAAGVADRVHAACGVIVHPCSYGGTPIEYPLHPEFGEDAVLATLAEIEAL